MNRWSMLLLIVGMALGCQTTSEPPPETPPPTPVPVDPPPSTETAFEAVVAAVAAGQPAEAAFAAAFPTAAAAAAAADVPFLDPAAGAQLRPKGGPTDEPPYTPGWQAIMGLKSPRTGWRSDFVSIIEVRPPHLGWYLGWSNALEQPVDVRPEWASQGIDEAFQSEIRFPGSWGCAEIRAALTSAYVAPGETKQTTDWSNVYVVGTCPSPMPPRTPLATPEPVQAAGLAAGIGLLAVLCRRPL